MLNFHGIWACFLFDIKKLLRSSRFYMTILVVCFVIWDHLAPISTWLAAQHYKITPWVLSFYFKLGVFTNGHCRRNAVFI